MIVNESSDGYLYNGEQLLVQPVYEPYQSVSVYDRIDFAAISKVVDLHKACVVPAIQVVDEVAKLGISNLADLSVYIASSEYCMTATFDRANKLIVFRRLFATIASYWRRASGSVVCEFCRYEYYDHPIFAGGALHILCDGSMVKL